MSVDREKLLLTIQDQEDKIFAAKLLDQIDLVEKTNQPKVLDFVDPAKAELAKTIVGSRSGLTVLLQGGYRQAERKRIIVAPDFYPRELIDSKVKVIEVQGNFSFRPVSHRDFLGSILGLGIRREKIGDIIITSHGCQVISTEEIGEFLLFQLTKVGRVSVETREIDVDQLAVQPESVKEIKTTVVSLRLDAVASSGFSTSRTKMVEEIKGEKVKVNWKPIHNPSFPLKQGDVISIRGRGRVVLETVMGETKKGRRSILLKRYI